MSYRAQGFLEADAVFQIRARACAIQQAAQFQHDARPDWVAVALDVLRDRPGVVAAFTRAAAAGPGIAERVDLGDGIDQSRVGDDDLLALMQANWPVVARLYFDSDGNRLPES